MNLFHCPWEGYATDSFPTCEKLVCAWIRQPLNTWSNLGFFFVAFYFIFFKKSRSSIDLGLGICSFIIACFSILAHASQISFFGALDFISIFLLLSFILVCRFSNLTRKQSFLLTLSCFLIASILSSIWSDTRNFIFAIFIVAILALEIRQWKHQSNLKKKRALQIFLSFTVGAVALGLDASKQVCFEKSHLFQLHALWHLACALSIFLLAEYLNSDQNQLLETSKDLK